MNVKEMKTGSRIALALVIMCLVPAPSFAGLIHGFSSLVNDTNQSGANPAAGLVLSGNVLCGTTLNGGTQGAGTMFYVTPDGSTFNAFRTFTNAPDAGNPEGELAVSGNGLFSTTFGGGSSSVGAVFVGQTNGALSLFHSFSAVNQHNPTNFGGASPTALIALSGNTIYGTTTTGGAAANGTVFSATTNGGTFSVLHDFSLLDSQSGTNADGAAPWGGLILSGGTLYGTASIGGAGGSGVVFSIAGTNFTVLWSFSRMDTLTATNVDGAIPFGGLVLAGGTLYGTTYAGGQNARGTIFSIQTNGLGFTVIHHFAATDPVSGTNLEGASPSATLILSGNILYGTGSAGGTNAAGSVFSFNTASSQFAALHDFAALGSNGTNADGAYPVAPMTLSGKSLYGTAFSGGPGGGGTVFNIGIVPSPAVITNIVHNGDGSMTLFFLGVANSSNIVEATTNITPPVNWQNVSTNVADSNGAWQFTDTNDTTSTKFYRSYEP